ncbi:TPA: DUF4355 domain-containing protein [Streptococcus suis]|nr:DUF4355 domain-containing protein [Streptococcus suis]
MSNFKPIETQEDLDRIISERLARQKEKYADYDQVKARVSELEKENGVLKSAAESSKANTADFEKQIAELQGQVKNYESKDLRLRVAVAKGLPIELADRLAGDDEEAIKADAERLASFMKPTEPTPPMASTEPNVPKDVNNNRELFRGMVQNLGLED